MENRGCTIAAEVEDVSRKKMFRGYFDSWTSRYDWPLLFGGRWLGHQSAWQGYAGTSIKLSVPAFITHFSS